MPSEEAWRRLPRRYIRIGEIRSPWPKALHEVRTSGGTVKVKESPRAGNRGCQGADRPVRNRLRAGVGSHASRHSQAQRARGVIDRGAEVVAVLTGNLLKRSRFTSANRYQHRPAFEAPGGVKIQPTFGNQALVVPNDPGQDRGTTRLRRRVRRPYSDPDFVVLR